MITEEQKSNRPLRAPLNRQLIRKEIKKPPILTQRNAVKPDLGIKKAESGSVLAVPTKADVSHKKESPGIYRQELIVFYSPKGGVGKTILAANTAVMLSKLSGRAISVALVDFDIQFGNVSSILNVPANVSVLNWIEGCGDLADGPVGIKVLPAPVHPYGEGAVTAEVARNILDTLYRKFDVVIVDTNPALHDLLLVSCDRATKIFLVTEPDRSALGDTDKMVSHVFRDLKIDQQKIQLVINKMSKRAVFRPAEISSTFIQRGIKTAAVIPDDPGVKTTINRQEIPALSRHCKSFNEALQKFLASFAPVCTIQQREHKKFLLNFWPFSKR